MIISRCDLTTLLVLYDEAFWHGCVLETLRKYETPVSPMSSADLLPLGDVVENIKQLPYKDR